MTSTIDLHKKNLKVGDAKPLIQTEPKKHGSESDKPLQPNSAPKRLSEQNNSSLLPVTKAKKEEDQEVKKAKKVELEADLGPERKKPKKVVVEDEEEDEEEEDVDDDDDDESEDEEDDESNISEIVSSGEEEVIEPIPPENEEVLAKLEADCILASIKGTSCVNGRVLRDRSKIVNPTVDRYGDKERELLFIKDEKKELIREIKIWRETPDLVNKVAGLAWPVLNVRMSLESIRLEHDRVRISLGLESTDEESESCDEDEDEEDEDEDEEEEEDDEDDEDDDDDDEEEEEEEEEKE
jgi:hypothetical protein